MATKNKLFNTRKEFVMFWAKVVLGVAAAIVLAKICGY